MTDKDINNLVEEQVVFFRRSGSFHRSFSFNKIKALSVDEKKTTGCREDHEHDVPIPIPSDGKRKRNVFDVINALKEQQMVVEGESGVKNILVRVDFNVPTDTDGNITDDSRIRGALPTIQAIKRAKLNAILVSHMGRPKLVQKGSDDEETKSQKKKLSLRPVAQRLAKLLKTDVAFCPDCIGTLAEEAVANMPKEGGGILILENLRFYKEEEKNELKFARALSLLSDGYVNDAFGTSHRAHASVSGVPNLKAKELCGIGCLVASEVTFLDFEHLESTASLTAIIGGSKVSTKLPVIEGLLSKVDTLILGGGLAFTFIKSMGVPIGNSLVEESMIETAAELLKKAESQGKKIVLPIDAVCSQSFPKGPMHIEDTHTFDLTPGSSGIENGFMGLDVGPKSVKLFDKSLVGTTKLVFNGPMGVFEIEPFDEGTKGLVDSLERITSDGTITVVGGGDSVAALEQFGKSDVVTYISTGGGATLELLSGLVLPGVAAISDFE